MPEGHLAASPKKGHHQRSLSAAIPVSVSYTNLVSASRRSGSKVCGCGRVGCACVWVIGCVCKCVGGRVCACVWVGGCVHVWVWIGVKHTVM